MALVNMNSILHKALEGGYAVPAISFYTMDDLHAIIAACEELKSPIILMTGSPTIDHNGLDTVALFARKAAELATVPVALHLDHATDETKVVQAIKAGYTSVMIDGSHLSYEDNVKVTRFIVRVAKPLSVSVEGEIGRVGMGEEGEDVEEILTKTEDAIRFAKDTGIDAIAVAVGTAHGMQTRDAKIHLDRIKSLSDNLDIPIVLHGSSGVSDEDLRKVVAMGICKMNIATRLRIVYLDEIRKILASGVKLTITLNLFNMGMNA